MHIFGLHFNVLMLLQYRYYYSIRGHFFTVINLRLLKCLNMECIVFVPKALKTAQKYVNLPRIFQFYPSFSSTNLCLLQEPFLIVLIIWCIILLRHILYLQIYYLSICLSVYVSNLSTCLCIHVPYYNATWCSYYECVTTYLIVNC